MYESEANTATAPLGVIPREAVAAFANLQDKIFARTVLSWSEHCTECVWPTCYTTCDLYSPREDGRCRRFVDGMVRIDCPESVNGYLLQIRFKQWGKLWSPGNLNLRAPRKAKGIEVRDYRFATVLRSLPLPKPVRGLVAEKRYGLKKRRAARTVSSRTSPTSFLMECYNPTEKSVSLSLTFRTAGKNVTIPYQTLATLAPGFQLVRVPFAEIANVIDTALPFNVEIIPNNIGHEITLYFGLMDFVQELPQQEPKSAGTKCVVWDLDNTVWNGTLTEDGAANLSLKPGILELITKLDCHGVVQSIASKNDHERAMAVLRQFHIDHLFLYPQISWSPKGEAIQVIARELNISSGAIVFVDDSAFELQQVKASCPEVRVLHANDYLSLSGIRECQVPITKEGMTRREMYKVEQDRRRLSVTFKDDYKAFLKQCSIKLTISPLDDNTLERVHELTQRTNQMNFSGTLYDRERLRSIMETPFLQSYVLACEDRFGSYGIVGFGLVDTHDPVLTDLMFSCRIQSKRIEHAFLGYIMKQHQEFGNKSFYARYRKTSRNEPSGRVFADLGMEELGSTDGVSLLVFSYDREIPDDRIVEVCVQGRCVQVMSSHECSVTAGSNP